MPIDEILEFITDNGSGYYKIFLKNGSILLGNVDSNNPSTIFSRFYTKNIKEIYFSKIELLNESLLSITPYDIDALEYLDEDYCWDTFLTSYNNGLWKDFMEEDDEVDEWSHYWDLIEEKDVIAILSDYNTFIELFPNSNARNYYGVKYGYYKGLLEGCDVTPFNIAKIEPEIHDQFNDFLPKTPKQPKVAEKVSTLEKQIEELQKQNECLQKEKEDLSASLISYKAAEAIKVDIDSKVSTNNSITPKKTIGRSHRQLF